MAHDKQAGIIPASNRSYRWGLRAEMSRGSQKSTCCATFAPRLRCCQQVYEFVQVLILTFGGRLTGFA